jgi:NADH-quinone oxidoreductase subunit C
MASTEIAGAEWLERAQALKHEGWWLADLCGVDGLHLGWEPRFRVVCQLLHHERKERLTLHVLTDGDPPTIASVVEIWPSANFMEREAFDMFGIHFSGHPNLTRILMPDEWEGHPLRKDYGVGKVAIEFLPQPYVQIEAPGQSPKPSEAGVDVDELGQTRTVAPTSPPREGAG